MRKALTCLFLVAAVAFVPACKDGKDAKPADTKVEDTKKDDKKTDTNPADDKKK